MRLRHLAANLGGILNLLEDNGYEPERFFQEIGIDPEGLDKPGSRIDLNKALGLWERVFVLFDDPCLGIKYARYWHPSQQGALGYAWLSSKTIGDGLNRMVRYAKFISEGVDIYVSEDADTIKVSVNFLFEGYPSLLPFLGTVGMANLLAMCQLIYGKKLYPIEVNFKQTKPACSDEFYAYFKSDIRFGMDQDSIIFSADILDKRLSGHNPSVTKYADQVTAHYFEKNLKKVNIAEKVKAKIIELLPAGDANVKTVASKLYLSERSLSRRLNKANTSFRNLLDETRKDMAIRYMKEQHIALHEIPYLLGYKDYASFFRAFKRWTGKSPSKVEQ